MSERIRRLEFLIERFECAIGIAKLEGNFAHAKSLDLRRQHFLKNLEIEVHGFDKEKGAELFRML